ncbi:hypothetical protein [Haloferax sp. Q22]|uniref:hypothetical protein n=1 Tax=Haloferax sp. (strain Q22) TaxID=1526048 RepID=UPI000737C963|nr:hypothetical protein [Haloferax sp. Q22]
MSDAENSSKFTQESLFTYIGDPVEQNMVFLEKGDVVRYEKYGKEMEAFFVAADPDTNEVKIRKTDDFYDYIKLESIKEKVEDPDIQEGFIPERDLEKRPELSDEISVDWLGGGLEITVSEFEIPEGTIEILVGYNTPVIGTRNYEHLLSEAHLTLAGPKTLNRRYRYSTRLANLNDLLEDSNEAYPLHPVAAARGDKPE